jgi:hypothetical protein
MYTVPVPKPTIKRPRNLPMEIVERGGIEPAESVEGGHDESNTVTSTENRCETELSTSSNVDVQRRPAAIQVNIRWLPVERADKH